MDRLREISCANWISHKVSGKRNDDLQVNHLINTRRSWLERVDSALLVLQLRRFGRNLLAWESSNITNRLRVGWERNESVGWEGRETVMRIVAVWNSYLSRTSRVSSLFNDASWNAVIVAQWSSIICKTVRSSSVYPHYYFSSMNFAFFARIFVRFFFPISRIRQISLVSIINRD